MANLTQWGEDGPDGPIRQKDAIQYITIQIQKLGKVYACAANGGGGITRPGSTHIAKTDNGKIADARVGVGGAVGSWPSK